MQDGTKAPDGGWGCEKGQKEWGFMGTELNEEAKESDGKGLSEEGHSLRV